MILRDAVTGAIFDSDGCLSGAGRALPAGNLRAVRDGNVVWVFHLGETYRVERVAVRRAAESPEAEHALVAPMPGRVRALLVKEGDAVVKGTTLLLLEAMKMEHPVRAPREGVVQRLLVAEGAMVSAGDRLAEIE
jgi:3-methylcrotonyl-CoA carboxylase alpha subunit